MSGLGGGGISVVKTGQGQGKTKVCPSCKEKHPLGVGNCKATGVKCDFCGKLGHLGKLCFAKKAQSQSQNKTPLDAAIGDSVDKLSLFSE